MTGRFSIIFALLVFNLGCAPAGDRPLEENFISARETFIAHLVEDAVAYAAASRNVDALIKLEKAHYLAPNESRILANLAVVYERLEMFEEADQILKLLLPKSKAQHQRQVQLVVAQTQPTTASPSPTPSQAIGTVTINQALLDFSYPKLLMQSGRLAFWEHDFKRAQNFFVQAYYASIELNQVPLALPALQSLSALNFQLGLEDESECYAGAELTTTANSDTLGQAMRITLARGRLDKLQALLKAQLPTFQLDPTFWVGYAHYWYAKRNYQEVYNSLERAVTVAGQSGTLSTDARYLRYLAVRAHDDKAPLVKDDLLEDIQKEFEEQLEIDNFPITIYWSEALTEDVLEEYLKAQAEK